MKLNEINETMFSLKAKTIVVFLSLFVAICSSLGTFAFTYGYFKRDKEAQEETHILIQKQLDELKTDHKKYTDLEVGGIRSDWDRDRIDQNKRIENLDKK